MFALPCLLLLLLLLLFANLNASEILLAVAGR
jgi:hypothetical protein